ncbi:hypothetical protein [Chryseobacterium sp. JUb7]|uniref:hypothetical protein n=1 Tax=Chryseobacterium sp. JUb7 TaxID=2940599 RepID=UPI002169B27E|nr:hypothetical protein [Chryseobacterium sp. JUb7]MCS3528725.1 hypothetical protein [Chryseobacterium sp. JUb7]
MKLLFSLSLSLLLSAGAFAQKKEASTAKNKAITEQYKNAYKKKNYKKFEGKIIVKDNLVQFDDKIIFYDKTNPTVKLILQEGLIYPQLLTDYQMNKFIDETTDRTQKRFLKLQKDPRASFDVNNMRINDIDYLNFLESDPKVKAFNLICKDNKLSGPIQYLIELTNKEANKETSMEDFIKNAKLTFVLQRKFD